MRVRHTSACSLSEGIPRTRLSRQAGLKKERITVSLGLSSGEKLSLPNTNFPGCKLRPRMMASMKPMKMSGQCFFMKDNIHDYCSGKIVLV